MSIKVFERCHICLPFFLFTLSLKCVGFYFGVTSYFFLSFFKCTCTVECDVCVCICVCVSCFFLNIRNATSRYFMKFHFKNAYLVQFNNPLPTRCRLHSLLTYNKFTIFFYFTLFCTTNGIFFIVTILDSPYRLPIDDWLMGRVIVVSNVKTHFLLGIESNKGGGEGSDQSKPCY